MRKYREPDLLAGPHEGTAKQLADCARRMNSFAKNELIWRASFQSRSAADMALSLYIYGFYNTGRHHQ